MRKVLLAGVIALAPIAAFAGSEGSVGGDINTSKTQAGSSAGVSSTQGTHAGVSAAGNGGVAVGAMSGNSTSVHTDALGVAGPAGSYTSTNAQQTNVGGTVAAGTAMNKSGGHTGGMGVDGTSIQTNGASGYAGGGQNSQATGSASAKASDTNVGGFMEQSGGHHSSSGH